MKLCLSSLAFVSALAIESQAFAGNPSAGAWDGDCTNVLIKSNATHQTMGQRASIVKACIAQAESIAKAAYLLSFNVCKGQSETKQLPDFVEIAAKAHVAIPAGVKTWDDFALSLGESANSAGCRDGIFSGLSARAFSDPQKLQTIFKNSALFLDNPLQGLYEVIASLGFGNVKGKLKVEQSNFQAQFTQFNLASAGNGVLNFKSSEFYAEGYLKGQLLAGFFPIELDGNIYLQGTISGSFDTKTLAVRIHDVQLSEASADGIPVDNFASSLQTTVNTPEFKDTFSQEFSDKIRLAYADVDPFDFLLDLDRIN